MKLRSSRPLLATLIACVLLLGPIRATAQVSDLGNLEADRFSFSKFLDLTACAVSIAAIETGIGATMAFLTCGKAAAEWWFV